MHNPRTVPGIGGRQKMGQNQGPLPFTEITQGLLAVRGQGTREVENVVPDLEGRAQEDKGEWQNLKGKVKGALGDKV